MDMRAGGQLMSRKAVGRRDGRAGRVVRLAPTVDTPTDAAMFSLRPHAFRNGTSAYPLSRS